MTSSWVLPDTELARSLLSTFTRVKSRGRWHNGRSGNSPSLAGRSHPTLTGHQKALAVSSRPWSPAYSA